MKKISVYKINRFRNHDFTRAYDLIVSQLEGEEFVVEDLQTAYTAMCAHNAKLSTIKNGEAKHDLTETMANMSELRHQYVLSLRGRVVYSRKSPFAEERDAANKVYKWLEKEQAYLRSRSVDTQAKSIYNIADTLKGKSGLQDALVTLGLENLFATIVETSEALDAYFKERTGDESTVKKQTLLMRNEAYRALKVFVVALEQSIALNKGDLERSLYNMNEIDRVIVRFATRYESEATRKKNAEEAEKAEAKAKAKADAESNQNGQTGNGEPQGDNVVTMGRKLALAGRSGASGTKGLDDMDLQLGDAMGNVALKNPSATNERVTSGVPLGGDDDKVADETAGADGAGETGGNAFDNTPTDNETTQGHNGAATKGDDEVDHES